MPNLEAMLNVQQLGSPSQMSATGGAVGGLVGAAFGQPVLGAAIGSAAGTMAAAVMPSYSHVRGSVNGVNFAALGLKPYQIALVEPDDQTAKNISDYCCYYGCKTMRTEPLAPASYMYNGHAYIQGDLHYNGTLPIDQFQVIREIFARGTHMMEA